MKKLRHATDFAPLSHTYFYFSWKVAAKLRLEYYFKRGKNNFNLFQESLIFFFVLQSMVISWTGMISVQDGQSLERKKWVIILVIQGIKKLSII